jgi:hypothetical protein
MVKYLKVEQISWLWQMDLQMGTLTGDLMSLTKGLADGDLPESGAAPRGLAE